MPEYFIGETCKLIMKDITVDSWGSNLLHAKSSFEWLRKISFPMSAGPRTLNSVPYVLQSKRRAKVLEVHQKF